MDPGEQPSSGAAQRRAAVDGCGPGHVYPPLSLTVTEEGQGREEASELNYTPTDRNRPPPTPVLFSMYEEEPGGGRLATLAEPLGPQERIPQRTVGPMLETFVPVPSLDVPVAQQRPHVVPASYFMHAAAARGAKSLVWQGSTGG